MWQPNDRFIVEPLVVSKRRAFRITGRLFRIPEPTLRTMILIYIYKKRLNVVYRMLKKSRSMDWKRLFKRLYFAKRVNLSIQISIKNNMGIWVPNKYLKDFMEKALTNPIAIFRKKDHAKTPWWDRNHENWAYSIIDQLASSYSGWDIDYILDMKYSTAMELVQVSNNRKISSKMDAVTAAIAGHVGSGDIYKDLKQQYIKRRVTTPISEKREQDKASVDKLKIRLARK